MNAVVQKSPTKVLQLIYIVHKYLVSISILCCSILYVSYRSHKISKKFKNSKFSLFKFAFACMYIQNAQSIVGEKNEQITCKITIFANFHEGLHGNAIPSTCLIRAQLSGIFGK